MIRIIKVAIAVTVWASAFSVRSEASPIVYIFSGIGTGTAGPYSFNNAAFSLKVYSDTSDVAIVGFTGGKNVYSTDASSALITVAGIGTGTFTEGTRVFDAQGIDILGFSLSYTLGAGDLWDFDCAAAGSYDLSGPVGPDTATPAPYSANISSQPTTLGLLTFNSVPTVTFSAVLVSEPSCIYLCGVAVVGALFSRRFVRLLPSSPLKNSLLSLNKFWDETSD
jgi:hypothetical protein